MIARRVWSGSRGPAAMGKSGTSDALEAIRIAEGHHFRSLVGRDHSKDGPGGVIRLPAPGKPNGAGFEPHRHTRASPLTETVEFVTLGRPFKTASCSPTRQRPCYITALHCEPCFWFEGHPLGGSRPQYLLATLCEQACTHRSEVSFALPTTIRI